jgi:hypothetical protein
MVYNPNLPMGLSAISGEILRQAQIVAYSNDFLLMFWVSLLAAFALLLMRKPERTASAPPPEAAAAFE